MRWIISAGIFVLIHMCVCAEDDLNMLLKIGGPNSQCNQSFELVEESSHTVIFDGDSFSESCVLTFNMSNTTIKDNDQRYSVCVKREAYEVSDPTITLMCYMWNDEGEKEATTPPQNFKESYIKLNVYAEWNMPVWMIIVISVSSAVALGLCIFVIVMCVIHFAKKRQKSRRARNETAGTTPQWRLDSNQPQHLQSEQYATKYVAFEYNQAFQPEAATTKT